MTEVTASVDSKQHRLSNASKLKIHIRIHVKILSQTSTDGMQQLCNTSAVKESSDKLPPQTTQHQVVLVFDSIDGLLCSAKSFEVAACLHRRERCGGSVAKSSIALGGLVPGLSSCCHLCPIRCDNMGRCLLLRLELGRTKTEIMRLLSRLLAGASLAGHIFR